MFDTEDVCEEHNTSYLVSDRLSHHTRLMCTLLHLIRLQIELPPFTHKMCTILYPRSSDQYKHDIYDGGHSWPHMTFKHCLCLHMHNLFTKSLIRIPKHSQERCEICDT